MTWTFYNAQGQEKRATVAVLPAGFVEFGMSAAKTLIAASSTVIPLPAIQRASTPAPFIRNGDGTLTCQATGQYAISVSGYNSTSALTAQRIQLAILFDGTVQVSDEDKGPWSSQGVTYQGLVTAGQVVSFQVYTDGPARDYILNKAAVHSLGGAPGSRGGKWWVSGAPYDNPEDIPVVGLVAGDVFLYPDSGDTFSYNGSTWTYTGPMPTGTAAVPVGSAFPTSGLYDNLVFDLQDLVMGAAGIRWRFVWRQSKLWWEFIGGPPLVAESNTLFSSTQTTFNAAAVAGDLSLDLPYPGRWDIRVEALLVTAAVASNGAFLSPAYGAGVNNGNDVYAAAISTPTAVAVTATAQSPVNRHDLGATMLNVRQALRSSSGSPGTVQALRQRRIIATPVRIPIP